MRNSSRSFIFVLFIISSLSVSLQATAQDCGCDIVFDAAEKANPFLNGDNTEVNPGDVICIMGGTYTYIRIINVHGTKEEPIIIKNCNGIAKIDLKGQNNHGFVMSRSTHFRVTGTGDPNHFYGIEIFNDPQNPGRTGMAIGENISDVELDHVQAYDVELGLHLINVPKCEQDTWVENWTMENASVHELYVHDTIKEGFYIGSSKYGVGHNQNCDGETLTLLPPLIKRIRVFNNKFDTSGWDSMQVSVAIEDCEIYNNECRNFGLENKPAQRAGIVVGGGSTGLVYKNLIHTGRGDGIDVFGVGNVRVFNNVIVDADGQGIFIGNREILESGYNHYVINNTIINSGEDNIRYNNEFAVDSKVINNLSINPGQKHVNYVKEGAGGVDNATNLELDNVSQAGFVDHQNDNYSLLENSVAVDAGTDVNALNLVFDDFVGTGRPANGQYDVGAYEYSSSTNSLPIVTNEIPNQTIDVETPFEFAFDANTFTDADGDDLSYTVALEDGSSMPSWMLFKSDDRKFEGTAPTDAAGEVFSMRVIADDGNGGMASDIFTITVNETEQEQVLGVSFEDAGIAVYPNPTSKFIKIDLTEEAELVSVRITSLNGAVAIDQEYRSSAASIDISTLVRGTYILQVEAAGKKWKGLILKE